MKNARGRINPEIVLGGALIHLAQLHACTTPQEAQDYVAEIDMHPLYVAIERANAQRKALVAGGLQNVVNLLVAVRYLQGDEQFAAYQTALEPILQTLEHKQ